MKHIFFITMLISNLIYSQDKNFNLIISIDGSISQGNISRLYLKYTNPEGKTESINANYFPGNLSIANVDYDKIISKGIKKVRLAFGHDEIIDENQKNYNYDIEINFIDLNSRYFLLYVYNTDKKCNRKLFHPLENKSYNYEYDSAIGLSSRLITKKKRKYNCNCN